MNHNPLFDRIGVVLIGIVLTGSFLIAVMLAGPALAEDSAKTATEKAAEYVETAKPTEDGTVHPQGTEAKPREQWFTPCPPDKKITKSGDCVAMDEAGSTEEAKK